MLFLKRIPLSFLFCMGIRSPCHLQRDGFASVFRLGAFYFFFQPGGPGYEDI
jgi:hypothetical protein